MKLAVSGKGGVGKTTFSALLIRTLDAQGKRVLAIDADPDANLASALGIPDAEKIVPIAEMKDLIFERTEAQPGTIGGFFKLNPKVDDLPDSALMLHIVLARDEVVVMDMEAGIEHLGRATASAVDKLIVVVEPGRRSMDTAGHIKKLASEIGLKNIVLVGNKIRGQKDEDFLKKHLSDFEFLGFIRQDEALIEADLDGVSPYDVDSIAKTNVKDMIAKL